MGKIAWNKGIGTIWIGIRDDSLGKRWKGLIDNIYEILRRRGNNNKFSTIAFVD